ncbi:hypothetical protein A2572_03685 [Candidatus Collierbacteria bacterium RIFOXYD1_FULL_40_9]|uniref:Uncharacterized protein n=1 Tax=Candidatus Collierbacteria bacterium RIFOXYD1_FULL_40_9 TaxID=1817731 RepID=A0A1F5FTJ5_9BACT|nr:MAG: hypothetical protein A2572_03685 [Candidatus Collierbacteria bacterium RIFOXYD1_FULL_40_9]
MPFGQEFLVFNLRYLPIIFVLSMISTAVLAGLISIFQISENTFSGRAIKYSVIFVFIVYACLSVFNFLPDKWYQEIENAFPGALSHYLVAYMMSIAAMFLSITALTLVGASSMRNKTFF